VKPFDPIRIKSAGGKRGLDLAYCRAMKRRRRAERVHQLASPGVGGPTTKSTALSYLPWALGSDAEFRPWDEGRANAQASHAMDSNP
jgi:hypothetical protein